MRGPRHEAGYLVAVLVAVALAVHAAQAAARAAVHLQVGRHVGYLHPHCAGGRGHEAKPGIGTAAAGSRHGAPRRRGVQAVAGVGVGAGVGAGGHGQRHRAGAFVVGRRQRRNQRIHLPVGGRRGQVVVGRVEVAFGVRPGTVQRQEAAAVGEADAGPVAGHGGWRSAHPGVGIFDAVGALVEPGLKRNVGPRGRWPPLPVAPLEREHPAARRPSGAVAGRAAGAVQVVPQHRQQRRCIGVGVRQVVGTGRNHVLAEGQKAIRRRIQRVVAAAVKLKAKANRQFARSRVVGLNQGHGCAARHGLVRFLARGQHNFAERAHGPGAARRQQPQQPRQQGCLGKGRRWLAGAEKKVFHGKGRIGEVDAARPALAFGATKFRCPSRSFQARALPHLR